MKIRVSDINDVDAILAIQERSPEAARWTRSDYERLAADPASEILVAELESLHPPNILGFAALRRILEDAELLNLAVDPDHRRQGVAKALLRHLRETLLCAGAKRLSLEVRASNQPARALYASLGFTLDLVRKNYYHDPPDDACVMSLELHPPTVGSQLA
jgi:ribosomal-protein-alanine N-acetyltransferase